MIRAMLAGMILVMLIGPVLALALPMQTTAGKWGQVSEGFQMSAVAVREVVGPGDPVVLELTIKNVSKRVLTLKETAPWRDYELSVKDEKGKVARLTKEGERLEKLRKDKEELKVIFVKLSPGQEIQHTLSVTDIYQMLPGSTYLVTAKRRIFNQRGTGVAEVVTNAVKIRVTG